MKRYYRTAEKAVANVMEKAVTNEVNPPLQSQSQELEEMTTIIPIDAEVFDVKDLPSDLGLRKSLSLFNVNLHDAIRREYIQRGPCQPKSHKFPSRAIANTTRKFQPNWFSNFSGWLEYSIEKDAAFCLYCYLFPPELVRGGDAFTSGGFTYWNKGEERFVQHEGKPTGAHFKAYQKYQAFKNQKQDIRNVFHKHSKQSNTEYRIRLNATVDVIRFILRQGLPFRGHDESENSNNRGNFLELLKFLGDHNEEINKVLCNTPKNNKLTHHDIQKQIANAAAIETTNAIIQDLGDAFFSILVDESRDISVKEQMSVLLRYVDKKGLVIERFLGVVHVPDTTAVTLKSAIDELFSKHNLSFSRVCGQGYDGASNMRGELGGLKTLILMENESAHYIHCFAHQLQLTLVAVAKNHIEVASLFFLLSSIVNVVGASCKRRDQLRERQAATIADQLQIGEIASGKGRLT